MASVLSLAQQPFDVIVFDLQMPDMNGVEFIRAMRLRPLHAKTPIVIASSEGEDSVLLQEARQLGVAAVVIPKLGNEEVVEEPTPLMVSQGARYLAGHHQLWLVALSVLIAATASFAALDLASRVTATTGLREDPATPGASTPSSSNSTMPVICITIYGWSTTVWCHDAKSASAKAHVTAAWGLSRGDRRTSIGVMLLRKITTR